MDNTHRNCGAVATHRNCGAVALHNCGAPLVNVDMDNCETNVVEGQDLPHTCQRGSSPQQDYEKTRCDKDNVLGFEHWVVGCRGALHETLRNFGGRLLTQNNMAVDRRRGEPVHEVVDVRKIGNVGSAEHEVRDAVGLLMHSSP